MRRSRDSNPSMFLAAMALFLSAALGFGQTTPVAIPKPSNKRIELATQEVERIKKLVELGAEARIRLEQAEQNLADAQDEAITEQMRYAPLAEQNDQMLSEMMGAAQRRLDRAKQRVDQVQKLSATGLVPQSDVAPLVEDLHSRQLDLDWALARAQFSDEAAALAEENASIAYPPGTAPAEHPEFSPAGVERYDGKGEFNEAHDLKPIALAFEAEFARPLPISADGETDVHRELGFDHRGRVDVALNPTDPSGTWLRHYLQSHKIPYYAFTHAVPGKATAAHIHIGIGSTRLVPTP